MADNSRLLIEAAAARRTATIERAREAIARLDRAGQPVSFRTVARSGPRLPAAQRATADSLRQRADALRVEVNDLRIENRRSREHSLAVSTATHAGDKTTTQTPVVRRTLTRGSR